MTRPRHVAPSVDLFAARTPTLLPATHTNSYALGDREVLLVEPATPYDDEQRAWLAWARELASTGRRLVGILLTHHHADHVGGAEVFARELGLPLWAHRATADRLPDLRVDRLLEDGETLALGGPSPTSWKVLHTPGHAAGHLCLLEERSRTILVGDMVASVGTILIAPGEGDMTEYLEQLERLAGLGADVALPAHGDPIAATSGPSPTDLFRFYIGHRLAREAKVVAGLPEGTSAGASLEELVPVVYADTSKTAWPIARMSLEAHLLKLERDGRAKRAALGWALT